MIEFVPVRIFGMPGYSIMSITEGYHWYLQVVDGTQCNSGPFRYHFYFGRVHSATQILLEKSINSIRRALFITPSDDQTHAIGFDEKSVLFKGVEVKSDF